MRSALPYPGSISTLSAGFGESGFASMRGIQSRHERRASFHAFFRPWRAAAKDTE
jgi:hypothetical protein